MSKPDDIPQDVWDASVHALHDDWDNPPLLIARAIMAEREACAALAGSFVATSNTRDVHVAMQEAASADTADNIAAAIRNRGAA